MPAGPAAICVQCGGSHWNPQPSCSGRTAVSTAGKEPGASVGSGAIWHKAPLIYSAANVLEERSDRCEHPAELCSCCRMPPCPLGAAACSAWVVAAVSSGRRDGSLWDLMCFPHCFSADGVSAVAVTHLRLSSDGASDGSYSR